MEGLCQAKSFAKRKKMTFSSCILYVLTKINIQHRKEDFSQGEESFNVKKDLDLTPLSLRSNQGLGNTAHFNLLDFLRPTKLNVFYI